MVGFLGPGSGVQITMPFPIQLHRCVCVTAGDGTETLPSSGVDGAAGDVLVEDAVEKTPALGIVSDVDVGKPETDAQPMEFLEDRLEEAVFRHDAVELITMQNQ